MDDIHLIERIISGDTHSFSEIVDKYKDRVFGMACRFTGEYSQAQDVAQEIFIRVFENLDKYNGKSKLSTWIYRISYNICIDWSRKNKRLKAIGQKGINTLRIDRSMDVEGSFLEKEERTALKEALYSLKEKYRSVLILHYFQDMSYEEMGEVMNLTVKTVETRLYRARKMLRCKLGSL